MNEMNAVRFFNEAHVLVMHTDAGQLRAYAGWIPKPFIAADSYVALAVACKKVYEEKVASGELPPLKVIRPPYAGAEDMNVQWGKDKTEQFKAAL